MTSPMAAVIWLPALAALIPLLSVSLRALQSGGDAWQRIVEYRLWDYLGNTLLLVVVVVLLCTLLGVVSAWLISTCDFPGRRTLDWLLILPLGVPAFVAGAAYVDGLQGLAPALIWVREQFGVEAFVAAQGLLPWLGSVLVLVVTLYPYVYLSCRASFAGQQADLIEAARSQGLGPLSCFWRVALPLARPAMVAGATLVAMEVANDYGVVSLFGVQTLTPGIFRAWSEGSLVSAMRLAFMLLAVVMFLVFVERIQRGGRRFDGPARSSPLARRPLRRLRAWLALAFCLLPIALGLLWPIWRLGAWALPGLINPEAGGFDWGQYGSGFANSMWLSLSTCALVIIAAGLLTVGRRAWAVPGGLLAQNLSLVGYAIPSALLAVAVGAAVSWLAAQPGLAWLALSASACGLLFAYFIRFLAVAVQPLAAGLERRPADYHAAARSLGHGPMATLWKIDLPLLWPAILAALILCFVDVFKELTLTLVLRPFDFETLATLTFRLTSEGRVAEAALPGLILIGGGLLGAVTLARLMQRKGHGHA